ncbi:MAG: hypothetical protein AAGH15_25855, partial [Myxococcota bacterium]
PPVAADPAPRSARGPALDEFEDAPGGGSGASRLLVAGLLGLIVLAGIGVAVLRPDVLAGLVGESERPDPAELERRAAEAEARERAEALAERDARYGSLALRVVEGTGPDADESARAQILLFVGRGPAVAENLPVGRAHELVAIAEGQGATRSVVPADAEWSPANGVPQYELAMQTSPTEAADVDLGPTQLPRDAMGAATGELGRVRVITNPPGAKVYLLVGFGRAQIDDLAADEAHELLVFAEDHRPERVVVGPSDWIAGDDGKKRAELTVRLRPADGR